MKKISVCYLCGSANVLFDASVHANDPADVRVFDDAYCEGHKGSCETTAVEVEDDFDCTGGVFNLEKLK